MIILKANEKMKAIYNKTISIMDQNVEWNGTFMINNNTLILPGELKSIFFNFDSKYAMGAVIEEEIKEEAKDMKGNATLESAINMLLYIFGKWGKIKGLVVDKSYEELTDLVNAIFSDIHATSKVTEDNCQFFMNGIQVTYEDVIEKMYLYLIAGKELDEDKEDSDKFEDKDKEILESSDSQMNKMGLWHKLVWKYETNNFLKTEVSVEDRNKKRAGKGFYLSNYICPNCQNLLYMAVYSKGHEFEIDTDKGKVITTRNYTCKECNNYFTAFPFKMLADNEVFVMDFDDDKTAYEDYMELVGSDGAKIMNSAFNRFADEEMNKKYCEEEMTDKVWKRRVYDLFETDLDEMTDEEIEEITDILDEQMLPVNVNEQTINKYMEELHKQRADRNITYNNRNKKIKNGKINRAASNPKVNSNSSGYDSETNNISKKNINKNRNNALDNNANNNANDNIINNNSNNDNNVVDNKTVNQEKYGGNNESDEKTNVKQFISRRSKVQVARRIANSSNEADFLKYVDNMDEEDLTEFIMEMDSKGFENQNQGQDAEIKNNENSNKIYKIAKEKLLKTQQQNILNMATEVQQKNYTEMKKALENIKAKKCNNSLSDFKNQILDNITKWMKKAGEIELNNIEKNIPDTITKEQYKQFKNKILEYDVVDNKKYLDRLEDSLDKSEQSMIKSLINKYSKNMGNRNMLVTLIGNIKKGGYKKENSEPFLNDLHDKLYDLDEKLLEKLVPNVMDLSFEEGMEMYKKIESSNFLPELKKDYLSKINRRLEGLKKDECRSLVNKFIKDTGLNNSSVSGIYPYDVSKMDSEEKTDDMIIVNNALNTFAICDKYEYPIFIYDATKNESGEKGFALTPDKIYYKVGSDSEYILITNVNGITLETGLFGKGIFVKYKGGQQVKISGNIKDKDKLSKFIVGLNGFIKYLKEKPQSRNIEYLAKEKHVKKCCYRCGFTFSEGNICPKCGGKNR